MACQVTFLWFGVDMEKQTARIYLDDCVNLVGTLRKNMDAEAFKTITILRNRVTFCSEHLGEVGLFCLIGIGLGLKVEYLIANSFFSPISVSAKDLHTFSITDKKVKIAGNTFEVNIDIASLSEG